MKRDMELVRKIALALEASPSGFAPRVLNIDGYSEEVVGYHALIMMEAGLLEGVDTTPWGSKSPYAAPTRLTWAGHEFVEEARDDTRWNRAMALVKDKGGSITIDLLTQLLASLMKNTFGLL